MVVFCESGSLEQCVASTCTLGEAWWTTWRLITPHAPSHHLPRQFTPTPSLSPHRPFGFFDGHAAVSPRPTHSGHRRQQSHPREVDCRPLCSQSRFGGGTASSLPFLHQAAAPGQCSAGAYRSGSATGAGGPLHRLQHRGDPIPAGAVLCRPLLWGYFYPHTRVFSSASGARGGELQDAGVIFEPAQDEVHSRGPRNGRVLFIGDSSTPLPAGFFTTAGVRYTGNPHCKLSNLPLLRT